MFFLDTLQAMLIGLTSYQMVVFMSCSKRQLNVYVCDEERLDICDT